MEAGLVEQTNPGKETAQAGRPRAVLRLDGRHLVFWGVHVGVRSTVLVISDGAGRVIRERTIALLPVPEIPAAQALSTAARELVRLGQGLPSPTRGRRRLLHPYQPEWLHLLPELPLGGYSRRSDTLRGTGPSRGGGHGRHRHGRHRTALPSPGGK